MRIIFIIIALLLSIQFAYSIDTDIENSDELSGCWERIIYPENVMARMSTKDFYHPELQKYQWYCFFDDNVFRVVTSNKKEVYKTNQIKEMFKSMPAPMTWKWVSKGIVNVEHKDDPNINAHWLLRHISKDSYVFGDTLIPNNSLFMAIPTPDLKGFVTVRILRKTK